MRTKLLTIIFCVFSLFSCTNNEIKEPEEKPISLGYNAKPFSTSDTSKILFSKGNLQYQPTTKSFRFAERQYDYVGEANACISNVYGGWVDLFGWGTGDIPTKILSTSDYSTYVDWGTNVIEEHSPNTWYCPTMSEINYIFIERKNASKLIASGIVDGIKGLILLPDDWICPTNIQLNLGITKGLHTVEYSDDCLYSISTYTGEPKNPPLFSHNNFTATQWLQLESAGAVFLPAAGCRSVTSLNYQQEDCMYWTSSSTINRKYRFYLDIDQYGIYTYNSSGQYGRSVRLVRRYNK